MNKIIVTCGLILACGFGANAMAQNATANVSTSTNVNTAGQSAGVNTDVAMGTRPVPAPGDRNCLRDTGSHIPPRKGECLPVSGNSYSREELQNTGQTDVGRALQELDPAVQVSHGHAH